MMCWLRAQCVHQTADIQAAGCLTDDQPSGVPCEKLVDAVGARQQRRNGPASGRIGTIVIVNGIRWTVAAAVAVCCSG